MPYGHIKQYMELIDEAEQKRIHISAQQERQIAKLYAEVAHDLGREVAKHKKNSLGHRWIVDYGKVLKRDSKGLYRQIQRTVESNMLATAKAVAGANSKFWGGIVPEVSERFTDVFSTIPQRAVAELMNGGIYKDFTGLSERLWNYQGQFKQDIGYIINQGILAHRSAYDLAKDLEMYLDPKYKCPYEWSWLYPRSNKVVDYSAQRLARTSITHAYQMAMRRSTQDNPFVEKYQWLASNAATGTCDLCRERNGKYFDKSSLPLDHPNGRCVVIPVIEKSYDEIAEEIRNWSKGGRNAALDKWLGTSGLSAGGVKGIPDHKPVKKLEMIDFSDKRTVQSVIEKYESRIVNSSVENAVVVKRSGEVVQCYGDLNGVYPDADLGEALKGAVVTHNHPIGSVNEYSFSNADINLFNDSELEVLRGIDEKYIYQLSRDPDDLDDYKNLLDLTEEDGRHEQVIGIAQKLKVGYRRWKRE
nr:MAG TPA: minor capsid protein [Caudoviricetes sp.]